MANAITPFLSSGADGDRTRDLLNAIQARSQLRHSPILFQFRFRRGFNFGKNTCDVSAFPLSVKPNPGSFPTTLQFGLPSICILI